MVATLMTNTIQIPLTKNQFAIIDECDADLCQLKWFAIRHSKYKGSRKFCAARGTTIVKGKQETEYMHRTIMSRLLGRELNTTDWVDHKDTNPLNNTRDNLRLCTRSQNSANTGLNATNTSGYKGVYFETKNGKWRARIMLNKKNHHLGYFDNPEEAHKAYREKAIELFGEFARFE